MRLIVGERYRPVLEKGLMQYRAEILWMPDNPLFDSRLAGHVDLSVLMAGKTLFLSKGVDSKLVNYLTNNGYKVCITENREAAQYPLDAGLCLLDTGKYLICNPKTADAKAVEQFRDRLIVTVSQGYTRCSCCAADRNSVITSDLGIARAAEACGMEALIISAGFICLPGFEYGFIGGAAIRLAENLLAFTGSLDKHPDKDRIISFLHRKGIEAVFLSKEPVFDIGGALILP